MARGPQPGAEARPSSQFSIHHPGTTRMDWYQLRHSHVDGVFCISGDPTLPAAQTRTALPCQQYSPHGSAVFGLCIANPEHFERPYRLRAGRVYAPKCGSHEVVGKGIKHISNHAFYKANDILIGLAYDVIWLHITHVLCLCQNQHMYIPDRPIRQSKTSYYIICHNWGDLGGCSSHMDFVQLRLPTRFFQLDK